MIAVAAILADFHRMHREHWRYEWGAAETGCVDCSGAFVWSYRQHGMSITHGSNAIARRYVRGLLPPSEARPGMAAFKARKPGQANYALPEKYRVGGREYNGDLNDYYHIGQVDEDTRYVLNAQSSKTGFVRSKLSENWCAVGYLSAVDYDGHGEGEIPMQEMRTMRVVCAEGETVRMRAGRSKNTDTVTKVKNGALVEAGPDENGWRAVEYDGRRGYMMSEFLTDADSGTEKPLKPSESEDGYLSIRLPRDAAEALKQALIDALGVG